MCTSVFNVCSGAAWKGSQYGRGRGFVLVRLFLGLVHRMPGYQGGGYERSQYPKPFRNLLSALASVHFGGNPKSGDLRANDLMKMMAAYDRPEKKYACRGT